MGFIGIVPLLYFVGNKTYYYYYDHNTKVTIHLQVTLTGTHSHTVTWYWSMMSLFNFLPTLSFIYMHIRQITQLGDVPVVVARNDRR